MEAEFSLREKEWEKIRSNLEERIHNEHNRTVASLNKAVEEEVDKLSNEYRLIYDMAKKNADDHTASGWASESALRRLLDENKRLDTLLRTSSKRQNKYYEMLSATLQQHEWERERQDKEMRQESRMSASMQFSKIQELEIELAEQRVVAGKLGAIASRLKMTPEKLLQIIDGKLG